MLKKTILITLLTLVTTILHAEGKLSVSKQAVLDVPPSTSWALLGDFNGLNRWHPAVIKSELVEGNGKSKGSKRILTLGDGGKIHETLIDYNDQGMTYTYKITESPLPVSDYVSTIKIERNDKGTSTVTWSSTFNAKGVSDEKAIEVISGVYDAGLSSLADLY